MWVEKEHSVELNEVVMVKLNSQYENSENIVGIVVAPYFDSKTILDVGERLIYVDYQTTFFIWKNG